MLRSVRNLLVLVALCLVAPVSAPQAALANGLEGLPGDCPERAGLRVIVIADESAVGDVALFDPRRRAFLP